MLKRSVYATGVLVALVFGLLLSPPAATAAKHAQLPPRYEHWLNEEVNYLITNQEREYLPGFDDRSGSRPLHRDFLGNSESGSELPRATPFGKNTTAAWNTPIPTYGSPRQPMDGTPTAAWSTSRWGLRSRSGRISMHKVAGADGDLVLSGSGKRACSLFFRPLLQTEPGGRLPDLLAVPGPSGQTDRQHQCGQR